MQVICGLALRIQLCAEREKNSQMFSLVTNLRVKKFKPPHNNNNNNNNNNKKCAKICASAHQHGLADDLAHLCFDVVLNWNWSHILASAFHKTLREERKSVTCD